MFLVQNCNMISFDTLAMSFLQFVSKRNWVFVTNSNFIIPKSQQPGDAYLSYFKLTLFDPPEFIAWNIYNGLRHLVKKKLGFKNPSLWQRLISFVDWVLVDFLNFCKHKQSIEIAISSKSVELVPKFESS